MATAEILKERGAYKIYIMATHGLLSADAPRLIEESAIDEVSLVYNAPPLRSEGLIVILQKKEKLLLKFKFYILLLSTCFMHFLRNPPPKTYDFIRLCSHLASFLKLAASVLHYNPVFQKVLTAFLKRHPKKCPTSSPFWTVYLRIGKHC